MKKMLSIIALFLVSQNSLQSLCFDVSWETYQAHVISEHPHFSGWCPAEKARRIMDLIHDNPSDTCVELGVYGGSSFFPLTAALAYKNQGMAYAIDPWANEACLEGYAMDKKFEDYWGKVDLNKIMYKFIGDMHRNGLDKYYMIMRRSSLQALDQFADESIDFIHIDGNHSELAALQDVVYWMPKVRRGGIICFDDAWWESTRLAVAYLRSEGELLPESSPKFQWIFVRKY